MAPQSAQKRLPPATEIPDRLYFRIGDVARICGVEPYVLRFWETQFPSLKPNKGGTGQRLYPPPRSRDSPYASSNSSTTKGTHSPAPGRPLRWLPALAANRASWC